MEAQPKVVQRQPSHSAQQPVEQLSLGNASLNDRVDLSRDQLRREPEQQSFPEDDDLSQVGIDLKAYSNIPESLQREKATHFSNLEFGDNVDLGNKKRRK